FFFFSSRRRHTRSKRDWSSDVCSSDLGLKKKRVRGGTLLDCGLRPVRKVVLPAQLEGELKLARVVGSRRLACAAGGTRQGIAKRSEEHTSELQSRFDLVCRLLLEKIKS